MSASHRAPNAGKAGGSDTNPFPKGQRFLPRRSCHPASARIAADRQSRISRSTKPSSARRRAASTRETPITGNANKKRRLVRSERTAMSASHPAPKRRESLRQRYQPIPEGATIPAPSILPSRVGPHRGRPDKHVPLRTRSPKSDSLRPTGHHVPAPSTRTGPSRPCRPLHLPSPSPVSSVFLQSCPSNQPDRYEHATATRLGFIEFPIRVANEIPGSIEFDSSRRRPLPAKTSQAERR